MAKYWSSMASFSYDLTTCFQEEYQYYQQQWWRSVSKLFALISFESWWTFQIVHCSIWYKWTAAEYLVIFVFSTRESIS